MIKILLVSHFRLAEGLKDTISYFNQEKANNITAISAYVDESDPKEQIADFIARLKDNEVGLIFTDIMGGSTTQFCLPYISKSNIYLFTGMNLGMLLQATFLSGEESPEEIKSLVNVGKE